MIRKHWQIAEIPAAVIDTVMREHQLSRLTSMLLAGRGLPIGEIESYLNPRLADLSDPYRLPGSEVASERLWQAIRDGEKILVFGDYDTDGITAAALLSWVLRANGAIVDCYLPHRLDDGYGLTIETVEKSLQGHSLLITVDCGITAWEATEAAKEAGVDVIITDHHQPSEKLPSALAVINPKLHDDVADLQVLAGVGVSFKLCHAFIKYGRESGYETNAIDLKDGLDLVALGTVADLVPLTGENRCLVKHGMKILMRQHRPGLRALCDISGINEQPTTSDIPFRLAPRLNAPGRLGNARHALELLQATGIVDAYTLAKNLDRLNKKRQSFEKRIIESANLKMAGVDIEEQRCIVLAEKNWHPGVIGIVASKLVQEYHRPTIVFSISDNGDVFGSGRSIGGVDLIALLDYCNDLLIRYGGHKMAVGLTLHERNLEPFIERFEKSVTDVIQDPDLWRPVLEIDGPASFPELNDIFFSELENLQPFGLGNEAPVLRIQDIYADRLIPVGDRHTRGNMFDRAGNDLSFIAYNLRPKDFPPGPWDVVATPEINHYNGNRVRQIQILDIRHAP